MTKKPAYLMTLEEYQKTVTPLIQEYNKFIKKNEQYFVPASYNGLFVYSFEELLKDVENDEIKGDRFRRSQYDKYLSNYDFAKKYFGYQKTSSFDASYNPIPTPIEIANKKEDYIDLLSQFFTEKEITRLIDKDEVKSNKRSVKRAIDDNTYLKLVESGDATIEEIENVANSVGVRLPKKTFGEANARAVENKAKYDKVYALMPSANKEVLSKMVDEVKETFKPLEEIIYETETKRYYDNIEKTIVSGESSMSSLSSWLPFWADIFNFNEKEERLVGTHLNKYKQLIEEKQTFLIGFSLKSDWKEVVKKEVLLFIEELKVNFIYRLIENFEKITLPILSIKQLYLEVGVKGFEGEYKFTFENGSSFDFKTEAIGAGGYNIQCYHFRYLSNFNNIVLSDGSKVTGKYNVLKYFSNSTKMSDGGKISEEILTEKEAYFEMPAAKDLEQFSNNMDYILQSYSDRKMAVIQAEIYLNEKGDIAKEWLNIRNISTMAEFTSYCNRRQTKLREGSGKKRTETKAQIKKDRADFVLSKIEHIAGEAYEKMEEDIRRYDATKKKDGGMMDKEIVCQNCGWKWLSSQSKQIDLYICHQCGCNNSPENLTAMKSIQQEYLKMNPIEEISVGNCYLLKEDVFILNEDKTKPEHASTRYIKVEVTDEPTVFSNDFKLKVLECNCSGNIGKIPVNTPISRSRKAIFEHGKSYSKEGLDDIYVGDTVFFEGENFEVGGISSCQKNINVSYHGGNRAIPIEDLMNRGILKNRISKK